MKENSNITLLTKDSTYGAAILAAPVFYIFYGILFYHGPLFSVTLSNHFYPFILLLFIHPLTEELVFRGLLQQQILYDFHKPVMNSAITSANLITSVAFSALHLFTHNFYWSLVILFPSLVFGYFADKYKSTKPSIILHVIYNTGYYLLFGTNL